MLAHMTGNPENKGNAKGLFYTYWQNEYIGFLHVHYSVFTFLSDFLQLRVFLF